MKISMDQAQGAVPVTILSPIGELDASNYQELIDVANQVYNEGARYVLLDMTETSFISSAGLVALHVIAALFRGSTPVDPETGWEALHAIDRDRETGFQRYMKLLNPQLQVDRVLEITGLKQFFEVYTDRNQAVTSFA
jgi:anti-anti-sigma regulatory factor